MQEDNNTPEIKKTKTPAAGLKPIQNKAPQKKKKKMSAWALLCIVLIVAVIGIFAAIYFDLGGAKQIAASLLGIETAADPADDKDTEKKEAELKLWEERLSQKEADVNLKEDGLDEKEDEQKAKEAELTGRENEVAKAEEEANEQREAYLQSVAKIFEKMDVKKAATAISGMETTQDMAKILLYMTSEQAALIMNQMKSALATEILSEMMK